ncbi:MAG: hypothetical protein ACD_75C02423G0022 [uncultured bacterium]|nr:MAG: hypothetical protein ACD_75C02423G0022 [uncultured bacterium]
MFGIFFKESIDEKQYVGGSFLERRDVQRNNTEAVVEILPEFALADEFLQVAVGCRENSGIDWNGFIRSDRFKLFFLDDPQQFGLQRSLHVTNFV